MADEFVTGGYVCDCCGIQITFHHYDNRQSRALKHHGAAIVRDYSENWLERLLCPECSTQIYRDDDDEKEEE